MTDRVTDYGHGHGNSHGVGYIYLVLAVFLAAFLAIALQFLIGPWLATLAVLVVFLAGYILYRVLAPT